MAARTRPLSDAALAVLRTAVVDGLAVRLTAGQLPRPLYVEVNDALSRIGGKWKGGKVSAHLFASDPTDALATLVGGGTLPAKNPDAYFPTPAPVVAQLLAAARLDVIDPAAGSGGFLLEPSAGAGAIADALRARVPAATLDTVEVSPERARALREKGHRVAEGDFLAWAAAQEAGAVRYDRIVMNPPFAVDGDALAYITHIEAAFRLLAPGGRLVAVAPSGFTFRDDRRCVAFRALVERAGAWTALPDAAFRESGTGVSTVVVTLDAAPAFVPAVEMARRTPPATRPRAAQCDLFAA